MQGIPLLGAALLGGVAGVAAKALSPKAKTPAAIQPPPLPTRLNAASRAGADALRRRRGAGANELTGGGAEARTPGGKTLLGQ